LAEGGLLEALPLGEVGLGIGAVKGAYNVYMNQQAQSRQYQTIEGGGIGGGYRERINEAGFRFGHLGLLSGSQANELYMGVTSQGYRGSNRSEALDVATEQFRRNGTSIQQTLQLMSIAAETGGKALNGVNDALNSVTDTARRNGLNAAQQRQDFISAFSTIAGVQGSGTSATAMLAAADVNATSGLGSQFAGVNLNGMYTQSNVYRQAASLGLSPGRFLAESSRNQRLGATAQENLIKSSLSSTVSPEFASYVKGETDKLTRKYGGTQNIPQNELTRIGEEAQSKFNLNPYILQSLFAANGIQGVTTDNASAFAVNALVGAANPLTQLDQTQLNSRRQAWGKAKGTKGLDYKNSSDVESYVEKNTGSSIDSTKQGAFSSRGSSPLAAYSTLIHRTGKTDPVIEALLSKGNIGQTDHERFQVQTKQGLRDLKISDAIKYYSDQLDTGNVKIVGGGDNSGKTIAEITNGMGTGGDITKAKSAKNDTSKGFLDDSAKGKKLAAQGAGATVTISPSTTLMQLFNFSATGNASIKAGAASGLPPTSSGTVSDLPNGQGG
jgi:hypothetical protein